MGESASTREIGSAARRAAVSVFLNVMLAGGKGAAGLASGSAALIGDALHSATDVFASGAALAGLWLAGKRHPSFPFGLYKAENMATLAVSVLIILAGYEIGRRALLGPATLPDVSIALPVAGVSLLVALGFGLWQYANGKRLGSPALKADGRDYLVDAASTAVVIAGLIGARFGLPLDRWAAGGVSLFVFWAGGSLMLSAIKDLMDRAMDPETRRNLHETVSRHPQVRSVESLVGRMAGGRIIVNLDVLLRTESHELADKVADRLEESILARFPRVVQVHIRTHFGHEKTFRRLTPVSGPDGEADERMGAAPWFKLEEFEPESGRLISASFHKNPHTNVEKKRGLLLGQWLLDFAPDELRVADSEQESGPAVLLRQAGVRIAPQEENAPEPENNQEEYIDSRREH